MPQAYWITTYIKILDVDKVEAYAKLAGPAIAAFDGKCLARGIANYAFESTKKKEQFSVFFLLLKKLYRLTKVPLIKSSLH